MEPFETRCQKAHQEILPILQKYQVDLGSRHFLKKDATGAKTLVDFFDSAPEWRDTATPEKVEVKKRKKRK